jgi:uncharacterized protein YmfQ (DUF2313 family)
VTSFVNLTLADFLRFIQGLLPRGAAWTRDDDAVLTQVAQAIADGTYVHHRATTYLSEVEADPHTALELLPDFETDYGLPDPCTPLNPTIGQRRAALLAKMRAKGGQSAAYFIAVAEQLGYTITIQRFYPFRVGQARVGDPLYGQGWIFAWRVHAPETTVRPFRVGQSAIGEPLRSWGNAELECVIRRIAPAETIVQFAYGG